MAHSFDQISKYSLSRDWCTDEDGNDVPVDVLGILFTDGSTSEHIFPRDRVYSDRQQGYAYKQDEQLQKEIKNLEDLNIPRVNEFRHGKSEQVQERSERGSSEDQNSD